MSRARTVGTVDNFDAHLGAAMQAARKRARSKVTDKELASAYGNHRTTVNKYLNGAGGPVPASFLAVFCQLIGVSPDEVLADALTSVGREAAPDPPAGVTLNSWAKVDPIDRRLIAAREITDAPNLTVDTD